MKNLIVNHEKIKIFSFWKIFLNSEFTELNTLSLLAKSEIIEKLRVVTVNDKMEQGVIGDENAKAMVSLHLQNSTHVFLVNGI